MPVDPPIAVGPAGGHQARSAVPCAGCTAAAGPDTCLPRGAASWCVSELLSTEDWAQLTFPLAVVHAPCALRPSSQLVSCHACDYGPSAGRRPADGFGNAATDVRVAGGGCLRADSGACSGYPDRLQGKVGNSTRRRHLSCQESAAAAAVLVLDIVRQRSVRERLGSKTVCVQFAACVCMYQREVLRAASNLFVSANLFGRQRCLHAAGACLLVLVWVPVDAILYFSGVRVFGPRVVFLHQADDESRHEVCKLAAIIKWNG